MDRGERSGVAGIERIEQRPRLDAAHLAQDDPVGPPAQRGLQQIVEGNAGLEGIGLAFDGEQVRLLQMKLRRILDDHDALVIGDCGCKGAEHRGLSGRSSAADEQRLPAANLRGKELRKRPRQRAASDKVIDGVMAAGELANGERRSRAHDRRNDRRQAASVRELRVEQRVVFVELFAELVGDHFEAGAQPAGVEGNGRLPANDPVALVPP